MCKLGNAHGDSPPSTCRIPPETSWNWGRPSNCARPIKYPLFRNTLSVIGSFFRLFIPNIIYKTQNVSAKWQINNKYFAQWTDNMGEQELIFTVGSNKAPFLQKIISFAINIDIYIFTEISLKDIASNQIIAFDFLLTGQFMVKLEI